MLALYEKNNVNKDYTSIGLFREVSNRYNTDKVLYPGCYVHITPSLIFSDVVYVDSFKNTYKFYEALDVRNFIQNNKEYSQDSVYKFYQQSYSNVLPEPSKSFDMIISQYGGFAGQDTKKYLKKGGILLCNNSHGDASMASIDPDYKLVAVYNRKSDDTFLISTKNLQDYLIPKKKTKLTKESLEKTMKGIAYTKAPSGYIFEKVM